MNETPTAAAAPADAILILGMHRSGTSALARALNLAGVELGDDLLPPAADNEQGFWEHRRIQFLHDRVYEALGRDWTNVSPLPHRWQDRSDVRPFRDQLRDELRRDFGDHRLWGVKDPRLCAMLPLWRPLLQQLNVTPRAVIIVRSPAEVAASLAKRDGLSAQRVALLWACSLIDAERNTRGLARSITSFDQLLADGPGTVGRIGRDLGLAWPNDPAAVGAAVGASLVPTSRHQRTTDAQFLADGAVPEPVRRLYRSALAAVASGNVDELSATADAVAAELDGQPLSPFVADLEAELRDATIAHHAEVRHLSDHLTRSAEAAAAADAAYRDAARRTDEAMARVVELDRHLAKSAAAAAAAHAAFVDTGRRADAATARAAELEHRLAESADAVAAATAAVAERDARLARADQTVEQLRLSAAAEAARWSDRIHAAEEQLQTARGDTVRAAADAATATAAAERQAGQFERELSAARSELATAYRTRDALGESLRALFASAAWTAGAAGRQLARAVGKRQVTGERLVPLTPDAGRGETPGSWHGTGLAQFLVPIAPTAGWARLRCRLRSSVQTRAVVYFDTGSGFHQDEHLVLGRVAGDTAIDRMVPLRQTAYLIRFDPVQAAGDWEIASFSFEPVSRAWFNAAAVAGNAAKLITGSGSHRPSPWLGLKLLLGGDFAKFHGQLVTNVESTTALSTYDLWRQRHALTDADRERMRAKAAEWGDAAPLISVILPVYNVDEVYLRACVESVLTQTYPKWELCIADDASPKPHVKRVLAEYARADARVKVSYRPTNGNIAAASNSALALATGDYVAMLDHDDTYAEHALFAVAEAIVADPAVDMVYSDEDKITPEGKPFDPFFKPDWSPEYFLACMYTCHLSVYRTSLVRQLGGWRSEFDSCQDYDLALRLAAGNPRVYHVPDVLYHWRTIPSSTASGGDAKPEAHLRARAAIQNHLDLTGKPGTVEDGAGTGYHRVRYVIRDNPLVSIVIPTASRPVEVRGRQTWFVLECVSSIRRLSTYANLEIVVVDNHDMTDELADKLRPLDVVRMGYTDPGTGRFNLARKLNQGAFAAKGSHLLLLNDDVEVITPGWVEAMLEFDQHADVGGVGPQLLFPDDTQQHNGVNLLEGNPGHPFYQFPADHPGYFNSSVVHRNWSAVTGACLMTKADVYRQLGGFSESFPLNYNDVDYCLRVRELGLRIVYTPYAKLYHHESVSKVGTDTAELEAFKKVWADRVPLDPYYNPNLTMQNQDFRIG